jgi:hypothetical protein
VGDFELVSHLTVLHQLITVEHYSQFRGRHAIYLGNEVGVLQCSSYGRGLNSISPSHILDIQLFIECVGWSTF